MRRLLSFLAVFLLQGTESRFWEFGRDSGDLQVITHMLGEIEMMIREKRIEITLQVCMEIKYVRVEVWNQVSTPAVKFDETTNTVIIEYLRSQISLSTFSLMIKGRRSKMCGGGYGGGSISGLYEGGGEGYKGGGLYKGMDYAGNILLTGGSQSNAAAAKQGFVFLAAPIVAN